MVLSYIGNVWIQGGLRLCDCVDDIGSENTDHGGGGGCTPHDGLYGEAPPERGIFFRLHEYGRLGISLVKGHKKVGKSVIWVCERLQKV